MNENIAHLLTDDRVFDQLVLSFFVAGLVFAPLERLAPIVGGRRAIREQTILDLCHAFYSGALIFLGTLALLAVTVSAVNFSGFLKLHEQPLILQIIEATIIADLGFYAVHRLFHASPALWRIHKVHHSINEMDWLAAHRVHPIDQIATKTGSLAPVLALGFSPEAVIIFGLIYKWQALLIHSNVDLRFGPLRHIFASPQFHHWHHANHEEAFDKNFAGQIPLIDRLFGTLYMPGDKMPERYGVDDPPPFDFVGQLLYPWKSEAPRSAPE